jgi:TonB family protein
LRLIPLLSVAVIACSSGKSATVSPNAVAPPCATSCRPVLINHARVADELRDAQSSLQSGGSVLVNILVDEAGVPADIQVVSSSGNVRLDALAVDMGRVMRFSPAVESGVVTPAWVQIPIEFRP